MIAQCLLGKEVTRNVFFLISVKNTGTGNHKFL